MDLVGNGRGPRAPGACISPQQYNPTDAQVIFSLTASHLLICLPLCISVIHFNVMNIDDENRNAHACVWAHTHAHTHTLLNELKGNFDVAPGQEGEPGAARQGASF